MNLLVLQHLPIEGPALIGEILEEAGHQLTTIELWHTQPGDHIPDDCDGLIIMGGPQSASDTHLETIAACLHLVRQAIERQMPMLGICLGAQLMARAAGASIMPSPVRELGWYPVYPVDSDHDPLFGHLDRRGLYVFQWHGETFSMPETATWLLGHPDVKHQAFRLGRGQYGLQFHIEVDADTIAAWIDAGDSERRHLGEQGLRRLHEDSTRHLEAARNFCRNMITAWIAEADHCRQTINAANPL